LTYEYDAAGNRISIGGSFARTGLPQPLASAVYDAANRLTQWRGTALTYDDNSNLTSDGVNTFVWDARDQLSSMPTASFQYDALRRRIGKTVGDVTAQFLYDDIDVARELGGNPATLLTGLYLDETLLRTDAAGPRVLLADGLGSTLALTDANGVIQTSYTYEPFGTTAVAGTPNLNPFQYTSRENDSTGLYYYRARYYHPTLQRFISEDPIGFDAGINVYAYADNDPIGIADPLGTNPVAVALPALGPVGWVAGGAVVTAWLLTPHGQQLTKNLANKFYRPHDKGARKSTSDKHQKGTARKKRDTKGRWPRKRPDGWPGGPYPPKTPPRGRYN
jgi:RHS repeat-associated protein